MYLWYGKLEGERHSLAHVTRTLLTLLTRVILTPARTSAAPVPPSDLCRVRAIPAHAAHVWPTKYRPVMPKVLGFTHEETLFSSNNCFSGKDRTLSHQDPGVVISFRSGLHFTETALLFFYSHQGKKKIKFKRDPTRTAHRSVLRPGVGRVFE